MKSAMDIALEKVDKMCGVKEEVDLTDEQKKRLAEIRKKYKGKIAEKEIMCQSEINKLQAGGVDYSEIQQVISERQRMLFEEKKSITMEMEDKIVEAKKGFTH